MRGSDKQFYRITSLKQPSFRRLPEDSEEDKQLRLAAPVEWRVFGFEFKRENTEDHWWTGGGQQRLKGKCV